MSTRSSHSIEAQPHHTTQSSKGSETVIGTARHLSRHTVVIILPLPLSLSQHRRCTVHAQDTWRYCVYILIFKNLWWVCIVYLNLWVFYRNTADVAYIHKANEEVLCVYAKYTNFQWGLLCTSIYRCFDKLYVHAWPSLCSPFQQRPMKQHYTSQPILKEIRCFKIMTLLTFLTSAVYPMTH